MVAGVTWGVGSQQLRWSRRRSADVGDIKAGTVTIEMCQLGCHLLKQPRLQQWQALCAHNCRLPFLLASPIRCCRAWKLQQLSS